MSVIALKIAIFLENVAKRMKSSIRNSYYRKVMRRYQLKDSRPSKKSSINYNKYELTDFMLVDALIQSGCINKEDFIFDIGCGTGLFLSYLATKGFTNLSGIEIDDTLFNIAYQNANQIYNRFGIFINLIHGDAINTSYYQKTNCFYLFNTFNDKETYKLWLFKIKQEFGSKKIKIIVLFPTVASLGAIMECFWLKRTKNITSMTQSCWRCVYFAVFENNI